MPTTPSPYEHNYTRYRKVPKRAKSGGLCGIFVLGLLAVPVTIVVAGIKLITQAI